MFFYQGIINNFFLGAVPEILSNNGLSADKRGILYMASLPYSFKFLWAPLADTYYWKGFGVRKSYIVPL